jgi:sialate O-acetylesterase
MKSLFPMRSLVLRIAACLLVSFAASTAMAEVKVPAIFTPHMVLQHSQKNPVWGTAAAGEKVTVTIAGQKHETTAGADGKWKVTLDAMPLGGDPLTLTIAGSNTITCGDVLMGEVWICSGQSNMQWSVNASNDPDLEKAAAKYPKIRLITVPNVGTQEAQFTFNGAWTECTPETVGNFSAVGYFFGRQIHKTADVPVGLINVAWGGSACEAWIRRDLLASNDRYKKLMDSWAAREAGGETDQNRGLLRGNSRPGNIYNGVLKPILGYGIRGAIWYQGESNAGRAYEYREMFPLMIQSWRDEWAQGDFPFYWVQLADFQAETPNPVESDWAELREAQTMTQDKLKNTGEAVIIDIGEGKDIHPKNKLDVGKRLARMALKQVYGRNDIVDKSPRYKSMEQADGKIILSFDHLVGGWRPFDVNEPRGFAIAGDDKKFVWAKAKVLPDGRIEVWSDEVKAPVSVRYGWANNPVVNMFSGAGLPLTPFRTDDWPGVTINN